MIPKTKILALLARYGGDILSAAAMHTQENYTQHGTTSVYLHCVNVAYVSVQLALFLRLHVNYRALVRGALLHDYFLYDWHVPSETHRGHGFTHAHTALRNASRDFTLNAVERDVIARHMFPLPRERARLPRRQILRRHRDAASAHPWRGCPAVLPQISDPSDRSPKRRMRK